MVRFCLGNPVVLFLLVVGNLWGGEMDSATQLIPRPLEIGSKAPSIVVKEWLHGKGGDPSQPDGKTVYIVEFWATWCSPCRQTIPYLHRLYQQYKDRGVMLLSLTREDRDTVENFAKELPDLTYPVGIDETGATHESYLAGVEGIPYAFLINAEGMVVWQGHPLQGLDRALELLLTGKLTPESASQIRSLEQALHEAAQQGDVPKMLELIDQLISCDPKNANYYSMKIHVFSQTKQSDKIPEVYQAWATACSNDAEGLAQLAGMLITHPDFNLRDPSLAIICARKAYTLSGGKDVGIVGVLGRVYGDLGLVDQALAILGEAQQSLTPQDMKKLDPMMIYYQKVKKAQQEAKEAK